MNFFEEIGIAKQYDSTSISQAIRNFNHSCELCICRGRNVMCSNCHIRGAHETVVSIFKMNAE